MWGQGLQEKRTSKNRDVPGSVGLILRVGDTGSMHWNPSEESDRHGVEGVDILPPSL